jgi:diaminopimelate epimerase
MGSVRTWPWRSGENHGTAPLSAVAPLRFWKGQALGNDYLVVDAPEPLAGAVVRALCDRHRGVGSDGLLLGDTRADPVALRIFNPDGTEAEKSGNGLRIFAAWLHARGLVGGEPFRVALPGEAIEMQVEGEASTGTRTVRVDMGTASFRAADVHFTDAEPDQEVMGMALEVAGDRVPVHLVSMGNPHCVVFHEALDPDELRRLAPLIQSLPAFRRGINVQLARVAGPGDLEALIWERGAGETMASGSSACAVAAAALRSGRVSGDRFQVAMPGGAVDVQIDSAWRVRLTGAAQIVFEGEVPAAVMAGWESTYEPARSE